MQRPLKRWARIGLAAAVFGLLTMPLSWSMPMRTKVTDIPISRLIKNIGDSIKAHPEDPAGYYTLARLNGTAYGENIEKFRFYDRFDSHDPIPKLPTFYTVTTARRAKTKPLTALALTHLADAISNYRKASELDPRDPKLWLGLGFECEEAFLSPQTVSAAWKALEMPDKPSKVTLQRLTIVYYRKAFSLTENMSPAWPTDELSYEAAQGIVRLEAGQPLAGTEQAELAKLKTRIAAYEASKSRLRSVSPILIAFDRTADLPDLLAPEKHVRFDIAGDGVGRSWPWVKPTTGILVWDPQHTGKITSGLQLFGNVTWWFFWKDGYAPLAALDNNRNGWLEGAELQGIAVWFDRNGNGVSNPGEVVSLSSLGIKRIATYSAGLTDGVPANPTGIQLRDGSSLPTFDWTPTSITK